MTLASYADEKRINEYLKSYWLELKGSKDYPRENEVSVSDLEPIWDSCFLVKLLDIPDKDGIEFSYIYLGKTLVEAYGDDYNEKEICERLVFPSSMSLLHKFRDIIATGKPADEESEFMNTQNMLVKYRSSMVPLGSNDGDGVGYILGGMKWKAF